MDSSRPRSPQISWVHEARARMLTWWWPKMLGIIVGMVLFFVGYFWLLRHPFFPVSVMPLTVVDRMVGFFPETLPLYVSLWVYVSLPPALLIDRRELFSYAWAAAALSAIGLGIFLFWPTTVPRADVDWSRHSAFGFLRTVDASGNACPSLHVAFAVFTAIWLARLLRQIGAGRIVRVLNWLWCAGILYSTMATRQHVALDVLAGTLLGAIVAVVHLECLRVIDLVYGGGSLEAGRSSTSANMPVATSAGDVTAINRDFYDAFWERARVHRPEDFNTWPLIAGLLPAAPERLEIGPGLHPRVPIAGSFFVDISAQ